MAILVVETMLPISAASGDALRRGPDVPTSFKGLLMGSKRFPSLQLALPGWIESVLLPLTSVCKPASRRERNWWLSCPAWMLSTECGPSARRCLTSSVLFKKVSKIIDLCLPAGCDCSLVLNNRQLSPMRQSTAVNLSEEDW